MDSNQHIIAQLRAQGMLPLFYHDEGAVCVGVVQALYRAGIRLIEFTNRGDQAFRNFQALLSLREKEMKDLVLAVGTIRTADQAKRFIDAGADFLISPVFDADVADIAYLQKVLWIPGCMTPTEIHVAENAGCRLVKLFPGNVLGPAFVSGIRELFPRMLFMPTGGVEAEEKNLKAWFDAGVCAVGMGSKLVSKALMDKKDFTAIEQAAKNALSLIHAIHK